ncbi:hypothetical protein [Legionella parisiensis]|uniref:Interaptin n=1 Tax=Legionella parisiensis TaxID=45071 RepID=A0A1E5JS70_9GAMM|nr:hypothetical protein [Legionella parisiensis]KTD40915.1 interaptin [Legionella parisiensis]OEH47355.1 hypothetical protein lpari_01671 [Legionella parisiensis]STX72141.1 interaptin [Legionella parisiensis]
MARNKEFLQTLQNTSLLNGLGTTKEITDALDAILRVDAAQANDFRNAVCDHQALWKHIDPVYEVSKWKMKDGRTGNDLLDARDTTDTFLMMKQAAAEQRIKFGISAIKDQSVLLQILSHNTDECRAYLATKVPEITGAHGWVPSVKPPLVGTVQPPDTNSSTNILTDDAIKRIKQQAANQFLTTVIAEAKADKLQLLENLLTHKNDPHNLKLAMEALGIPVRSEQLFAQLDPALKRAVKDRVDVLKNEIAIAKFKEELQKFEDSLKKPEDLLKETGLLGKDTVPFLNDVGAKFPPPPPDDYINRAKGDGNVKTLVEDMHKRLCAKYVEEKLKKVSPMNVVHMAEVLKETTHVGIKTKIDTHGFIPEAHIRNRAIVDNPEQNRLFKASLIKSYVKELTGTPNKAIIEKLAKPETDIKEIRRELAAKIGNGITEGHLECLQDSDLKEIKESARREAFKLLAGEGNHSKLIEAFSSLPDKKQQELLNLKPESFRSILNAKTKGELKFYLGNDVNGKDDYLVGIITENKSNAFIKQINNIEIVKILVGLESPVTITGLNSDKIKAINDILLAKRAVDLAQDANIADYKAVIDELFTQCGITNDVAGLNKQNFYAAFNLNPAGTAFVNRVAVGGNTISDKIQTQHSHNQQLYAKLHTLRNPVGAPPPPLEPGYEKLLDVLLRVEKQAPLNPDAPVNLRDEFYKSSTLDKFLTASQLLQPVKDQLKQQLSTEDFNNIRKGLKTDTAKSTNVNDTTKIKNDIDEAEKAYEVVEERTQALKGRLNDIAVIVDISPSHGKKAPQFVGQSQEKLRKSHETYKSLQKECLNSISYLDKAYKEIQALRPTIPVPLQNPPASNQQVADRAKQITEAKQLDRNINYQLNELSVLLDKYRTAYKVTTKEILPALEKAYKDSERVTYQSYDLTITRRSHKDALNMGHKYTDPDDPHIIAKPKVRNTSVLPGQTPESLFKSTGKPGTDEVICFDTSRNATVVVPDPTNPRSGVNKSVTIEGRFTYDPSPKGGISGTMTGTDVTRAMPGKYEVVQSPKDNDTGKHRGKEVVDEQVDFYMKMASQILSNVKLPLNKKIVIEGVRGKEDEVKFLHTALLLTGEKIGLKPGDFKVVGDANYNPQNERKKTAGIDRGFSDTSWYKQHFESRKDGIVKNHLEKFEDQHKDKKTQAKKTEKVSSNLQSTMKEEFSVGREIEKETREKQKQEGISPEVARVIANNS